MASPGDADPGRPDDDIEGQASGPEHEEEGRARTQARVRRVLADLFDSGQAIRKGSQDLVAGVALATKEEALRIVTSEIRGFLDKLDVVDLTQQMMEGLVVDIHTKVRFERSGDGKLRPAVGESETQVSLRKGSEDAKGATPEDGDPER